jgi:hypothetical protein
MGEPFIGSAAVAAGRLTPYQLRSRFVAVHRDVYVARDARVTAVARAKAAWLWSGRAGVVAGRSAAVLHGAKWVEDGAPAEILYDNRRPPRGLSTWSDQVAEDEIETVRGMAVTTPARTALDLARHRPLDVAVAEIDALARAARLKAADIELLAERFKGRRGIREARVALDLVDPGAESPQETRVRLLLIRAGFPRRKRRSRSVTSTGSSSPSWTWAGGTSRSASTMRANTIGAAAVRSIGGSGVTPK